MQTARPRIFHRSFCKFLEVPDISAGNAGGDSVSIFVRSIVERTSNMVALPILSAVGQVERFIDQRKVRHNIAENRVFQKGPDRKSTRLNSSHMSISYAVFCLKKKK